MPTVKQLVHRLFPSGTNQGPSNVVDELPLWPPDLFGAAASIVHSSGCYSQPRYTFGIEKECFFAEQSQLKNIVDWGREFGMIRAAGETEKDLSEEVHSELQALWDELLGEPSSQLDQMSESCCDAAVKLMLVADQASSGIGFITKDWHAPYAGWVFYEHANFLLEEKKRTLRYLPFSLCRMIPDDELCVQPKTMTAQVGCTLRSLSHHLALLPAKAEVKTKWLYGVRYDDLQSDTDEGSGPSAAPNSTALNLLLVPFPFSIPGNCFDAGSRYLAHEAISKQDGGTSRWRFFTLNQNWLQHEDQDLTAQALAEFIQDLVSAAKREVDTVHGIVLPESALDQPRARHVAELLAAANLGLDLFVTGVIERDLRNHPVNGVQTYLFVNRGDQSEIYTEWFQSKHHRWKLDRGQICRYQLGGRLDPDYFWWEQASIQDRSCIFYVFRDGMSLTALVCEDLARIDPVQTVIRSIGPNLVIALLMDGPQLQTRWSARYATVLADDPGSAVLSLTSLGLIRRCAQPGKENTEIGLWKGAESTTKELQLPKGHHALLVTLSPTGETNFTQDGRSDEGMTYKLSLTGQHALKHRNPPPWAVLS